jgi:hypothetical protein
MAASCRNPNRSYIEPETLACLEEGRGWRVNFWGIRGFYG